MLLFRLKKRKKYLFLFELLFLSACAHGILGLLLFVVYQGSRTGLHIDISAKKTRRPALFISCKRPSLFAIGHHPHGAGRGVSMQAPVAGSSGASAGRVRRHGSTTSVEQHVCKAKNYSSPGEGNAVASTVPSSLKVKKDEGIKKNNKKVATGNSKESKKKIKKEVKKEILKKQVTAIVKKGPEPVVIPKQAKKEPVPVPVPPVAQAEPKKEPAPLPIAHNIVEEKQQFPVAQNMPLPHITDVAPQEAVLPGIVGQEIDESMGDQLVGQEGYGEYEDYEYVQQEKMREAITSEIELRWKPPKGLSKELACELRICIGQGGKVVECAINKPSGVLIYDMAARVAARAMSLPRWAWGKEFTIAFRQ